MICLLGLVLAVLCGSGCSHVPSDWRTHTPSNPASLAGRTTTVVPIKGEPVILQNSQVGALLLGGIFGVAIEESLIKKAEELSAFVVDYRKCARQLSETLLKKLKLIRRTHRREAAH